MSENRNRFTDHDWIMDEDVTPVHHHDKTFLCSLDSPNVDDATILGNRAQVSGMYRAKQAARAGADAAERLGNGRFGRRTMMQGAGAGLGALMATSLTPRYAFAGEVSATPKDTIVAIFLRGAFDGLSAVVPYSDAAYYAARPTISVPKDQVIPLNSTFGLHPELAPLLPAWNAKEFGIVHAAGQVDPSRSHFYSQDNLERAAPANVRSGWLGRHLETSSNVQGTFRAITVGARATASLAAPFPTLSMASMADFDMRSSSLYKTAVLHDLDLMYGDAGGQLAAQADGAFNAISRLTTLRTQAYTPSGGAKYPETPFGKNLSEIARMIKAGLGVEVACLDLGNWDMHYNLGKATDPASWMARQLRDLALGLAAFRTDLGALFEKTVVVTMSEFGRRLAENGNAGLDHGHGQAMFFLGGGINGGTVYGQWPGLGAGSLDSGDLAVTTDYRHPLHEIVSRRLSNTRVNEVFPGFTPTPLNMTH